MPRRILPMVLAGCLTTPPPPNKAPYVDGCAMFASAVCHKRDQCSDDFANRHEYGDEATCESRSALPCLNNSQVLNTGQAEVQLEQCAAEYPSMSCAAFLDTAQAGACAIPAGPGDVGSPCGASAECRTAFCATGADQICGTCQPLPKIGDPCLIPPDCGRNLACAIPSGMIVGACAVWKALDEPCLSGYQPCGADLSCVGDDPATMTSGTCQPAAGPGDACDGARKLQPSCDPDRGIACIPETGTVGTCQPTMLVGPGETCGQLGTPSTAFAACVAGGMCVKASPSDHMGTCVAAVADGEACDRDTTRGPPCLAPAKCVAAEPGGTAGVCMMPDARMCN